MFKPIVKAYVELEFECPRSMDNDRIWDEAYRKIAAGLKYEEIREISLFRIE